MLYTTSDLVAACLEPQFYTVTATANFPTTFYWADLSTCTMPITWGLQTLSQNWGTMYQEQPPLRPAQPPGEITVVREDPYQLAREKAKKSLLRRLTDEQAAQLGEHQYFELRVGERLYRIGPMRLVERVCPQTRRVLSTFCIHPEHRFRLPPHDVAIAQKLLLETNEQEFLRIANERRIAV